MRKFKLLGSWKIKPAAEQHANDAARQITRNGKVGEFSVKLEMTGSPDEPWEVWLYAKK